ncbi:MAG: glycosyltransferase [bacterium]|nr:glycosyltransferase [bacterium]
MRLLLVGAFPYPHHQGSQVYFQEQAIALRAAGAEVELLTYGRRDDAPPEDPERWRALDGFVHHTIPRSARPRSSASGPSFAKPRADQALRRALHDAIASRIESDASFDALLTHNVEACVISLSARVMRSQPPPPILYCVHTLLRHELSAYIKLIKNRDLSGSETRVMNWTRSVKNLVDGVGSSLDRFLARRADGWIALTQSASRVMRQYSDRPGAIIAPPLPDPRHRFFDHDPAPSSPSGPFFLYSGNLDPYQELPLLEGAARRLASRGGPVPRIVVASFDSSVDAPGRSWAPGIEPRHVTSEAEMQALTAAARATLVPRRAVGGFPIKLANSLANGTPAITFHDREWGLEDGRNVRVADRARPVDGLAEAIARLADDPEQAREMGVNARARYEAAHLPAVTADQTLGLIEEVRIAARRP